MMITGFGEFLSVLRRNGEGGRDSPTCLLRKEVIHRHLPVPIPCYDLVLIADLTVVGSPPNQKHSCFWKFQFSIIKSQANFKLINY